MSTLPIIGFIIYATREKVENIKYRDKEDKDVWKRAKKEAKEIEYIGRPTKNEQADDYYAPFTETELYAN